MTGIYLFYSFTMLILNLTVSSSGLSQSKVAKNRQACGMASLPKNLLGCWVCILCDNILFLHAIVGCDTSRLFGIEECIALKGAMDNQNFCLQAGVFSDPSAEKNNIISTGERANVCLYVG